jgi:AcrR family transcriptional regulator
LSPTPVTRLPAAERRQALIETAVRVFSAASYHGVTTAAIAREAGVSEPILYRHFASKRDLYLACIAHAWKEFRESWEDAIEREQDPKSWVPAMARAARARHHRKAFLANLWIQALTEAGEDAEIRKYLRRHARDVHEFVSGVIRRSQAAGGIPPDRDAAAEAWIFIAVGLLATFAQRLGGVLAEADLAAIAAARSRWLTAQEAHERRTKSIVTGTPARSKRSRSSFSSQKP